MANNNVKNNKSKQWDLCHPKTVRTANSNCIVPKHLYTDENPATTIKGTGFKDRKTAERTIMLTSQKGVRYKQYWTIRAMRERAVFHPQYQTHPGMRDAVEVFDKWLKEEEEKPPLSSEEQTERQLEWEEYWNLCNSIANSHSYSGSPSKGDLKRARDDLKCAKNCFLQGIELAQSKRRESHEYKFPLAAFTALFGGPGLHGYGSHRITSVGSTEEESVVEIDGIDGLKELIPHNRTSPTLEKLTVNYKRKTEMAKVAVTYIPNRVTISGLWNNLKTNKSNNKNNAMNSCQKSDVTTRIEGNSCEVSWMCNTCTFEHIGVAKHFFLVCEVCRSSRNLNKVGTDKKRVARPPPADNPPSNSATNSAAWGSLRAPTSRDIQGPRKRHKALDAPPPLLDFLVVMDLEWTADDKKKMEPIAEITQLPSVAMRLVDKKWGRGATTTTTIGKTTIQTECNSIHELPPDLTIPCDGSTQNDAYAISAFDTYVRPSLNPTLTQFSVDLTAITQDQVDAAPRIDVALKNYMDWLESLDLVDSNGLRRGNWCFCTWGDVDIMGTLRREVEYKSLVLPPCFDRWVNLKSDSMFKKHYGREPKGGLRACVESVGANWDGRAHNGLVDSFNTAKIVRHMVQTGFRFTRPTRGLDKNGVPFGQKKK